MYHDDGLTIELEDDRYDTIEQFPYPSRQASGVDLTTTRAIISVKPGSNFEVVLNLRRPFTLYSAEGVKVTIAVGHTHQEPGALNDVQAWWIPKAILDRNDVGITHFWCWEPGAVESRTQDLRAPAPQPFDLRSIPDDGWADSFNAAKGCIAIYVVRGNLIGEVEYERETYLTDPPESLKYVPDWPDHNRVKLGLDREEASQIIHPIRWEWFTPLQSENGEPYVFEFRNVDPEPFSKMNLQSLSNDGSANVNADDSSKRSPFTSKKGSGSDADVDMENDDKEGTEEGAPSPSRLERTSSDDFDEDTGPRVFNPSSTRMSQRLARQSRLRESQSPPAAVHADTGPRISRSSRTASTACQLRSGTGTLARVALSSVQSGDQGMGYEDEDKDEQEALAQSQTLPQMLPEVESSSKLSCNDSTQLRHKSTPTQVNASLPPTEIEAQIPSGQSGRNQGTQAETEVNARKREKGMARKRIELTRARNRLQELLQKNEIQELELLLMYEEQFGESLEGMGG